MTATPWLIATDVDGTLFGQTLNSTPRVKAAIRAAQQAGHHVTLATGRAHGATVAIADDHHITEPLICHQGALIQRGRRVLYHWQLPVGLSREILAYASERRYHVNCYIGDRLLVMAEPKEMKAYTALVPMLKAEVVPDLVTTLDEGFTKIVFVLSDAQQATNVLRDVSRRWGARAQVVQSHALFVEVTNVAASKGNALMVLAEWLGIPTERTLAVGDNMNDVSMIRAAGVGVAMGDAEPGVYRVADWIAPPLREDGLAAAIERFVLEGA